MNLGNDFMLKALEINVDREDLLKPIGCQLFWPGKKMQRSFDLLSSKVARLIAIA